MQRWDLLNRFIFWSLGLIALLVIALGWTITSYLTETTLKREQRVTADFVRHVVDMHISTKNARTAELDLSDPRRLRQIADELWELHEVVRIKVFDPEGTIIWSDVPTLIGQNFRDNRLLRESLGGRIVAEFERLDSSPEHKFEQGRFEELMALYVPIHDKTKGDPLAVFEVYKDSELLREEIDQKGLTIWGIVLAGSTVLFLGQFALVRRASVTIKAQYRELSDRAEAMESINKRLETTQAQLVAAERLAAIGEVTAAVAHGIRNPLGNIRSVAQEASQGCEPTQPIRENLDEIVQQVDLLEERLRSFLSTTKSLDFSLAATSLEQLVEGALTGIRNRAKDSGTSIDVDVGEDIVVQCDAAKIEEALQELLVNSLEAGAHAISVVANPSDDAARKPGVRLTIQDDGAGVSPAAVNKSFDPFYTTKPLGTGLGLVVACKIIAGHQGELSLQSGPTGGTQAIVWLPLAPTNGEPVS